MSPLPIAADSARQISDLTACCLRVRQLAHLAHGMATRPARGRVGRGVYVHTLCDVDADAAASAVDQTSRLWDQQRGRSPSCGVGRL